jgi:DNA modification methylase
MLELLSIGRIAHRKGKVPLLKRYLDEMKGKIIQDIWTDIPINCNKSKRFPTQKPEALLERIVNTSSNPFGVVYEPFAGSSTTGVVCDKLRRRWIGSEISEQACSFSIERLREKGCEVRFFSKPIQVQKSQMEVANSSNNCGEECFRIVDNQ